MELWLLATSAPALGVGPTTAAWIISAVAIVLAGVGRRRWPPGVGEGLFVAGVSGLLLSNYVAWGEAAVQPALLSAGFVSLAVVWVIVAAWIERGESPVRRALAAHAVAVSGLLVLPAAAAGDDPLGFPGLLVRWLLLLGVAGVLYWRRRHALARSATWAAAIGGPLWLLRDQTPSAIRPHLPAAVLAFGVVLLAFVVGVVLADWRRRVRAWQTDPRNLLSPAPRHRHVFGAAVAGCVLLGAGGMLCPDGAVTPLGVILAGYAALVISHRWCSDAVGAIGMTLIAEAIVLAVLAWTPDGPANLLLGFALAGAFLQWLAGFWSQQLCDGRPWTTTGRLIPVARNLSLLAVGGQVLAAACLAGEPPPAAAGAWSLTIALVLMLLHGAALARDAKQRGCAAAALAAGLVLVAAIVPANALAAGLHRPVPPVLWPALAAVMLALVVGPRRRDDGVGWTFDAYLGALLPLAVAFAFALSPAPKPAAETLAAAIVGAAMALALRFARRPAADDRRSRT